MHSHYAISADEAYGIMQTLPAFVVLDVRTEDEFRSGHVRGARLIPYTDLMLRAEKELPDKTLPIFVYCRIGQRSAIAARTLIRMGYTTVYDFGAIYDWQYGID